MKNILLLILLPAIAFVAVFFIVKALEAGNEGPITGSPQTPVTAVATYANASADMIVVDLPAPGALVSRSILVSGKARGNWYFEASFPIRVTDQNGTVLFEGPMTAQSDWMTTEFVPFSSTITVPGTYTGPAVLVLQKDNPSGEPARDASVSLPIIIQ